jgi:ABC-type maltose transport system permease subunit
MTAAVISGTVTWWDTSDTTNEAPAFQQTASSVMIAAPAAVLFLLVQRHLVTGLTAGATKS